MLLEEPASALPLLHPLIQEFEQGNKFYTVITCL